MLNMLRMDLRRMFRSRMFYIAFLCLTAGILIMIIMLHTITDPELREQAIDAGMKFTTTNDSDFDEIRQMSETEAPVSYTHLFHAKFLCLAVHQDCEGFLRAGYGVGKGQAAFCAGGKKYAVKQIPALYGLAGLEARYGGVSEI